MSLTEWIIILLVAQSVCSLQTLDVGDLLHLGPSNSTEEPSSPVETGIRGTITNVFTDLDQIFRRLLDIPVVYSVYNPEIKRLTDEDSKGETAAAGREPLGVSEAFDKAFDDSLCTGDCGGCECGKVEANKDIKVPEGLPLDIALLSGDPLKRGPRPKRNTARLNMDGFPYVVLIGDKTDKEWIQTGVALSDKMVVTSSLPHKLELKAPQLYVSFRLPNGTHEVDMPVMKVEPVPGEDLAFLHLLDKKGLDEKTYPSLAGITDPTIPVNCSVVGWDTAGLTSDAAFLRTDQLSISFPEMCKQKLSHFNDSRSFCSVSPLSKTHHNAVGSALICSGRLFGLTPRQDPQDRFTRISPFRDIIQEKLKNSEDGQEHLFEFMNSGDTRRTETSLSSATLFPLIIVLSRYFIF